MISRTHTYTYAYMLSVCLLSRFSVSDSLQPLWAVAHQAPLSMGFPRQEYWGGLPCPSSVDLCDPGIKPGSPAFQAVSCISDGFFSD